MGNGASSSSSVPRNPPAPTPVVAGPTLAVSDAGNALKGGLQATVMRSPPTTAPPPLPAAMGEGLDQQLALGKRANSVSQQQEGTRRGSSNTTAVSGAFTLPSTAPTPIVGPSQQRKFSSSFATNTTVNTAGTTAANTPAISGMTGGGATASTAPLTTPARSPPVHIALGTHAFFPSPADRGVGGGGGGWSTPSTATPSLTLRPNPSHQIVGSRPPPLHQNALLRGGNSSSRRQSDSLYGFQLPPTAAASSCGGGGGGPHNPNMTHTNAFLWPHASIRSGGEAAAAATVTPEGGAFPIFGVDSRRSSAARGCDGGFFPNSAPSAGLIPFMACQHRPSLGLANNSAVPSPAPEITFPHHHHALAQQSIQQSHRTTENCRVDTDNSNTFNNSTTTASHHTLANSTRSSSHHQHQHSIATFKSSINRSREEAEAVIARMRQEAASSSYSQAMQEEGQKEEGEEDVNHSHAHHHRSSSGGGGVLGAGLGEVKIENSSGGAAMAVDGGGASVYSVGEGLAISIRNRSLMLRKPLHHLRGGEGAEKGGEGAESSPSHTQEDNSQAGGGGVGGRGGDVLAASLPNQPTAHSPLMIASLAAQSVEGGAGVGRSIIDRRATVGGGARGAFSMMVMPPSFSHLSGRHANTNNTMANSLAPSPQRPLFTSTQEAASSSHNQHQQHHSDSDRTEGMTALGLAHPPPPTRNNTAVLSAEASRALSMSSMPTPFQPLPNFFLVSSPETNLTPPPNAERVPHHDVGVSLGGGGGGAVVLGCGIGGRLLPLPSLAMPSAAELCIGEGDVSVAEEVERSLLLRRGPATSTTVSNSINSSTHGAKSLLLGGSKEDAVVALPNKLLTGGAAAAAASQPAAIALFRPIFSDAKAVPTQFETSLKGGEGATTTTPSTIPMTQTATPSAAKYMKGGAVSDDNQDGDSPCPSEPASLDSSAVLLSTTEMSRKAGKGQAEEEQKKGGGGPNTGAIPAFQSAARTSLLPPPSLSPAFGGGLTSPETQVHCQLLSNASNSNTAAISNSENYYHHGSTAATSTAREPSVGNSMSQSHPRKGDGGGGGADRRCRRGGHDLPSIFDMVSIAPLPPTMAETQCDQTSSRSTVGGEGASADFDPSEGAVIRPPPALRLSSTHCHVGGDGDVEAVEEEEEAAQQKKGPGPAISALRRRSEALLYSSLKADAHHRAAADAGAVPTAVDDGDGKSKFQKETLLPLESSRKSAVGGGVSPQHGLLAPPLPLPPPHADDESLYATSVMTSSAHDETQRAVAIVDLDRLRRHSLVVAPLFTDVAVGLLGAAHTDTMSVAASSSLGGGAPTTASPLTPHPFITTASSSFAALQPTEYKAVDHAAFMAIRLQRQQEEAKRNNKAKRGAQQRAEGEEERHRRQQRQEEGCANDDEEGCGEKEASSSSRRDRGHSSVIGTGASPITTVPSSLSLAAEKECGGGGAMMAVKDGAHQGGSGAFQLSPAPPSLLNPVANPSSVSDESPKGRGTSPLLLFSPNFKNSKDAGEGEGGVASSGGIGRPFHPSQRGQHHGYRHHVVQLSPMRSLSQGGGEEESEEGREEGGAGGAAGLGFAGKSGRRAMATATTVRSRSESDHNSSAAKASSGDLICLLTMSESLGAHPSSNHRHHHNQHQHSHSLLSYPQGGGAEVHSVRGGGGAEGEEGKEPAGQLSLPPTRSVSIYNTPLFGAVADAEERQRERGGGGGGGSRGGCRSALSSASCHSPTAPLFGRRSIAASNVASPILGPADDNDGAARSCPPPPPCHMPHLRAAVRTDSDDPFPLPLAHQTYHPPHSDYEEGRSCSRDNSDNGNASLLPPPPPSFPANLLPQSHHYPVTAPSITSPSSAQPTESRGMVGGDLATIANTTTTPPQPTQAPTAAEKGGVGAHHFHQHGGGGGGGITDPRLRGRRLVREGDVCAPPCASSSASPSLAATQRTSISISPSSPTGVPPCTLANRKAFDVEGPVVGGGGGGGGRRVCEEGPVGLAGLLAARKKNKMAKHRNCEGVQSRKKRSKAKESRKKKERDGASRSEHHHGSAQSRSSSSTSVSSTTTSTSTSSAATSVLLSPSSLISCTQLVGPATNQPPYRDVFEFGTGTNTTAAPNTIIALGGAKEEE